MGWVVVMIFKLSVLITRLPEVDGIPFTKAKCQLLFVLSAVFGTVLRIFMGEIKRPFLLIVISFRKDSKRLLGISNISYSLTWPDAYG